MSKKFSEYLPGILLFCIAVILALFTYKDYGMSWDEPSQRTIGLSSYNYIFNGNNDLLTFQYRLYGAGFELPLIFIEKILKLTDTSEIFMMRHLVNHLFFLISGLCGYFLVLRLFRNKFLASLGFIMLVFAPRIYAHSFFNTKDVPFLSMFLITLCYLQYAFQKNKVFMLLILGLLCGYTTGIRVMGIILYLFSGFFLLLEMINGGMNKEKTFNQVRKMAILSIGFFVALYISWPYLWGSPIMRFGEAFARMSHFGWEGKVLLNGHFYQSKELPVFYFPVWFTITNPILWLLAGFAGIALIIVDFFRRTSVYMQNTPERNQLLYIFCFAGPVFAVLALHSTIYDDWRHLYFVYPPFILTALWFLNKLGKGRLKFVVQALCMVQVGFIGYFMVVYHPFSQVYFNETVSHKKEFLRKNYELDYWGPSNYDGLKYLLKKQDTGIIKVSTDLIDANNYDPDYVNPLTNNLSLLPKKDRDRIQITIPMKADYFITLFRGHPGDFDYPAIEHSFTVLNSTVLCIYRER